MGAYRGIKWQQVHSFSVSKQNSTCSRALRRCLKTVRQITGYEPSVYQISPRFGISYEGYTAKRPGHRTRSVVKKKVIQAAAKVAALAETVDNYEQNKTRYRGLMLEELNQPVWTAEFERIIQIQLELQEEEDLIALLI